MAIFEALTSILPSRFKLVFGPDIRDAFEDEAIEAYRQKGVTGLGVATGRGVADVLISAWCTRLPSVHKPTRPNEIAPHARGRLMNAFRQDLRDAFRTLRKQPATSDDPSTLLRVGLSLSKAEQRATASFRQVSL